MSAIAAQMPPLLLLLLLIARVLLMLARSANGDGVLRHFAMLTMIAWTAAAARK